MINKKKKVIALSVVALVLASLVVFGLTTYAWIDDVKLVEFNNDDLANNSAPLKTGTDINSTVNITKDNNTVDLGNMLENSDITYTDNDHAHIKYDTSSPNNTKNPDMDEINEKKGYFYEVTCTFQVATATARPSFSPVREREHPVIVKATRTMKT